MPLALTGEVAVENVGNTLAKGAPTAWRDERGEVETQWLPVTERCL